MMRFAMDFGESFPGPANQPLNPALMACLVGRMMLGMWVFHGLAEGRFVLVANQLFAVRDLGK
jgi:hypothetical protein